MRVSIALCTYNGARFIGEQLDSIAAQSRPPDELVVCDDRSDDDTVERVRKWAENAAFPVRIEVNRDRLGSTRNFAKAIGLCSGDLIALCDQDDVWLDHKLAEANEAFTATPPLGCWATDARLVDEELRLLPGTLWQSVGLDRRWRRKLEGPDRLAALLRRSFITGATMVFDAKYKPLILPIPDNHRMFIHDRWIATLIGAVAPIGFSSAPSMLYRQHSRQQIGTAPDAGALARVMTRVPRRSEHYAEDLEIARTIAARLEAWAPAAVGPVARRALDERIALLEMRNALPERRWRRVQPVARALLSGIYSRHAEGAVSAAKDFLL